MKKFIRFLLILPIIALFLPNHILSDMVSPLPLKNEQPVSEDEIRDLLHSNEFKQMLEEFAPGASESLNLTPEEEEEIIRQTQAFTEKLEGMTEEEQQQEVEKMLRQLPAPQQAEQKMPQQTQKIEQQPTAPKIETKPALKKEKIVIDTSDTKKLIGKIVKSLEDIEIKFESMPRVSKQSLMEQKWAEVKEELPLTISMLKRIEKKADLLEKLASQEFSLLRSQLKDLYQELQPQRKKLTIPDTAIIKNLSDEDLSRAEPATKSEKKKTKQAVDAIIKILSRSIQNINYGNKKLLEKYAPEELKKINEEFKSKAKEQPYSTTKPSRSDYSPYYGGGGSYRRPSSGYYPSGRSTSSPTSSAWGSPGSSEMGSPKKTGTTKGKEALKEDKEKETTKDSFAKGKKESDKDKGKKEKTDPVEKSLNKIKDLVKDLEEKVQEAFVEGQLEQTMRNFATLDPEEDQDARESINNVRLALSEVNPLITTLAGEISKFNDLIKKAKDEIKDNRKKQIKEYLDHQNKLKLLLSIAEEFTKPDVSQQFAASTEKTTVITHLNQFLKSYQDIIDNLKTFEMLQKALVEINEKASKFIVEKNIVSTLNQGTPQQRSAATFKSEFREALKFFQEYQQTMKKLESHYGKEKIKGMSGAANDLANLLESTNIPSEIQLDAKILKKQLAPSISTTSTSLQQASI